MQRDVTLGDVATRTYVGVTESDTLDGTIELLSEESTDTAVVLRGQKPVGVLPCSTVLDQVAAGEALETVEVSSVMDRAVETISADSSVAEGATQLANADSWLLVLLDGEAVYGTVDARDLVVGDIAHQSMEATPSDRPAQPPSTGQSNEYSTQGICEDCGALSRELSNYNGQLICADCMDV